MSDTSAEVLETRRQAEEMRNKLCRIIVDKADPQKPEAELRWYIQNNPFPWEVGINR